MMMMMLMTTTMDSDEVMTMIVASHIRHVFN